MALLSTGDGRAVAVKGWVSLQGRWAWLWKDYIDRKFMRKYDEDLPELEEMMKPGG